MVFSPELVLTSTPWLHVCIWPVLPRWHKCPLKPFQSSQFLAFHLNKNTGTISFCFFVPPFAIPLKSIFIHTHLHNFSSGLRKMSLLSFLLLLKISSHSQCFWGYFVLLFSPSSPIPTGVLFIKLTVHLLFHFYQGRYVCICICLNLNFFQHNVCDTNP